MSKKLLEELLDRVSRAVELDSDLLIAVSQAVRRVFPDVAPTMAGGNDQTGAVLHLVDQCLPRWTISLTGKAMEPDGRWRCHLRESASRDDDEVMGFGEAPTVSLALLSALLRLAAFKAG